MIANREYKDFDINERINLKALLSAWTDITVERFQGELKSKLYGSRISKKGVQRSLLSNRYRFGSGKSRTNNLRTNWRQQNLLAGSGSGLNRINISFPLYGRFVDMGVGKGTDYATTRFQRDRKNGETPTRKPVRWYSRRKGYETHRLRELMTRYYVSVPIELLENALTTQVALTL